MKNNALVAKVTGLLNNLRFYWKEPPKGRFMSFKEIFSYSFGGIGAYMIITLGTACLLAANNTLLSSVLGIAPMDMYVMYVIAVLSNIPLTAVRANIIDNTRNKAGKYRPYIVTMAIPSAIICVLMVWFPYDSFGALFGEGEIFGNTYAYIAKCAVVMILNLLLHFFYYFFYDGYENLIHVLSPNSQERADVASVKSIVYSFAPTIVNLFTPIIAQHLFHTNTTDIRVYRFLYPILSVLGLLLCVLVYKNTEEKIIQARTHVVQIKFTDALRAVAKNKYFWIISLASWIGFLETAYANIMKWLYDYGGACSGTTFGLIQTVYGNASLWGMLAAPFCIRKWGKKAVLVVTNIFNIIFILAMLLFTEEITYNVTILLIMSCLWLNALMGSFAHILNPSIQADIRDYQQYKTGERIDGMFSAVNTIGTVLALATSSVLPFIYEKKGLTVDNALKVTSDPEVLNRVLGDGETVGQLLEKQLAQGQNNYANAYSALYDPDILLSLINVLVIVAAVGAFMNVVPFFWYDFNERKQKSVVRVLKVRAMFEDYGNDALDNHQIVEAIDLVQDAREMACQEPKSTDKSIYKSVKGKLERKEAKKQYKDNLEFNEEIEISKFVCEELDKFDTANFIHQVDVYTEIYNQGLEGIANSSVSALKQELSKAKKLPKSNKEEKELRSFEIELAKKRISAKKNYDKHYGSMVEFKEPDMNTLTDMFDKEDAIDEQIESIVKQRDEAKKNKDKNLANELNAQIKNLSAQRTEVRKQIKQLQDEFSNFNRAAKPYVDAEKLLTQRENYMHFDDIAALYDQAKIDAEEEDRLAKEAADAKRREEEAELEAKKAQKAAKKAAKKNK